MSITPFNNSIPMLNESELKSYQMLAKIVASNPHWRQLGGETKEKKLADDEVISTILCVMLLAREIGLPPMQAIAYGIYNIKGKFEISARGMNQLIRQRGHKLSIKLLNHEVCTIWGKRRDTGEEMECRYHVEEAKRAGLIKDFGGWAKNPQDMVFARAISRIGRRLFADCIGGFYIEGELKETILKETVEGVEVPSIDELGHHEPEKPVQIEFQLPPDLTLDSLNNFIEQSASASGKPKEAVITRANQNPDGFINALRTWEDRQVPKELELQEIEV